MILVRRWLALATVMVVGAGGGASAAPACGGPGWVHLPTADDLAAVYPVKARADGTAGKAVLACTVQADGMLGDCAVDAEEPAGAGFGAAALALASKLQAPPRCADTPPSKIRVPIRFELPKMPPSRRLVFRETPKQYAATAPLGPFWPEMALRKGLGGAVVLDCRVNDANQMSECADAEGTTPGTGFSDALRAMAKKGWVTAEPLDAGVAAPADQIWRFSIVLGPHKLGRP